MGSFLEPMYNDHHPVWGDRRYRLDLCNMIDDAIVLDIATGRIYRIPITPDLLSWLRSLVASMDDHDKATANAYAELNVGTRSRLLSAAQRYLDGYPPILNTFDAEPVSAANCTPEPAAVDQALSEIISRSPGTLVRTMMRQS